MKGVVVEDLIKKEDFENWMKGLRSELIANCCMIPKSDAEQAWNDAMRKACRHVDMYKDGEGLFQL